MKLKPFKIIIIIFILLVIAGAVYLLTRKENSSNNEESKEISYKTIDMVTNIRMGISNFDSIHPYQTNNQEVIYINQLIFEPLLSISEDYRISMCLAEEWSRVNEKTYIVKLKENVKWHDDNNFTSEDVKFSIDRLQNQTESIFYQNVKNIKNVEVIDKYTIRIELKEEEAFFEYNLIFPIVSSKQYKNKSFNYTSTPVGTGKYKITKTENDKIELSRNDNWRDIDIENSNLKTIYINIYDSRGKEYNSFKLGSIDFIHTSSEESEEYIGSLGYNKKTYENREYDYLALNCKNTILQYQEIRQAISMIIDKEKIVASVLENKATIANYPLLNNYYLTVGLTKENKTNKTKAKEILENSGWNYEYGIWQKEIEGITKTINIDLVVSKENKKRIKVATELKVELEEFGIKINIKEVSNQQYNKYLKNKNYEMILTGMYIPISPNLDYIIGKSNLANYENEQVNTIMNEINTITDEIVLKEKYAEIFKIYDNDVPYIGLYYNHDTIAYSTDLMGDVKPNCYSIFYNFSNWYRQ